MDQKVISTGLYGFVRHPMYIGVLIMYIPTPVAPGSYWGLIPIAAIPLALVLREIRGYYRQLKLILKETFPGRAYG